MLGSDRYLEAWKALNELFGRVDTVVSVAKKRQFPAIVKEKSEQIRQYQEIVSEVIGYTKNTASFTSLKDNFPRLLLLNFLFAFVVNGLSLWKESRNCPPGSHLPVGWKERRE